MTSNDSMTLLLDKYHGLGNDFVVAFDLPVGASDPAELARRICHRRRGIGADGLLVADTDPDHDAAMRLWNSDGTTAEISGNGIRCFAHALVRRRGEAFGDRPVELFVRTGAGVKRVVVEATPEPATVLATVEMGEVVDIAAPEGWVDLGAADERPVAHLSLGNPHSVVAVEDLAAVDLAALGAKVPGVNLEIVAPGPTGDAITMRVHERGAGVTAACGSGACATAVAAARWGLATPREGKLVVHMDGGSAIVELVSDGARPVAVLRGPSTHVATIEIEHPLP